MKERMSKDMEHSPLSRQLKIDEIRDGASGSIEATKTEMAEIAQLLDLPGLDDLVMTYRLSRAGTGRFRLKGDLKARVTQTCIVSLEPVESNLDVPVEAEFWPAEMIAAHEEDAEEHGSAALADWPEPIDDGRIDLGPILYETLATSLDPYPKMEGVSFQWSEGSEMPGLEEKTSPFAALGALKRP
jgi:uncharacterized metal-binding protein YceD (DUF177 family)